MTISTCTSSSLARNISSAAESKGISVHSGCIQNTFGKNISMGNPNGPVFIPKDVHSMPKSTPKFTLNPQVAVFTRNVLLRVTDMISDSSISNLNHILSNLFPTGYNLSPETSEYGNDNRDIYSVLDDVHRVICSHININSIRYKIDMLSDFIKDKIDILCVDESFPSSSFIIKGIAPPFRKDRT